MVLDSKKSDILRRKYIEEFVNTTSQYYKRNIAEKTLFSDGMCYKGYLWDCLLSINIITETEADKVLLGKDKMYIMWDIHSIERIFIPNYWKFPKTKLLCVNNWTKELKEKLPEDVYVFDDTFSWSIIYTHETYENDERYCILINK